jgi:hypothetical protein
MGQLVFISYRRDKGYALAHLVDAELRSRGVRTFLDVSESDPGQFWLQIKAAIGSCRALVLICTNGSFETKAGDDWVLREVSEATALGRPIVPVFSQDFKRPEVLPPLFAQATEYNGVSMDTQFHVAAFDHLSQLVGGRKRSEQRRRVAVFATLASLALLGALALGGREILGLTRAVSMEQEARKAVDTRSEELSKNVTVFEKTEADMRHATEERERRAREETVKQERDRVAAEQNAAAARQFEEQRQQVAAKIQARYRAEDEEHQCNNRCYTKSHECVANGASNDSCRRPFTQCQDDCVDTLHRVCSDCAAER